jgi:hypothetical protein
MSARQLHKLYWRGSKRKTHAEMRELKSSQAGCHREMFAQPAGHPAPTQAQPLHKQRQHSPHSEGHGRKCKY